MYIVLYMVSFVFAGSPANGSQSKDNKSFQLYDRLVHIRTRSTEYGVIQSTSRSSVHKLISAAIDKTVRIAVHIVWAAIIV